MSKKSVVLAVAGALLLSGGIGTASASTGTASRSTATASASTATASTADPTLRKCLDDAAHGVVSAACARYAREIKAAGLRPADAPTPQPVPATPRFTG